jgi:hypothetical protein
MRRLPLTGVGAICAAAVMTIAGSASASTAADPHYDSRAHWRVVLKTRSSTAAFIAIAASGPRSAWAIGDIGTTSTYLMHWNGTAWRKMAVPAHFEPYGVSGSSPTDVWLVGDLDLPGPTTGQVLRWNGRAWSRMLITQAVAIIDISPANVWEESVSGHLDHWNGTSWTRTTYQYAVNDRPGTVAGVGQQAWRTMIGTVGKEQHRLIIQRWTGTAWRGVSSPHPYVHGKYYPAISASAASNVWIEMPSPGPGLHNTRLLHWDGATWTTLVWPWDLADYAVGRFAAAGGASVWLGNGQLLRNRSGWHLSNDGGCGIPVGVPRTNSALCAGTMNISAQRYYGVLSQSGPLP